MTNEAFVQYEKDLDAWFNEVTKDPKGYKKPWKKLLTSRDFLWRIVLLIGSFASMVIIYLPNTIPKSQAYTDVNPFLLDLPYIAISLIVVCSFIGGLYHTIAILLNMYHFAPIHAYAQRDYYKSKLEGLPVLGGVPTLALPLEEKRPLLPFLGRKRGKDKKVEIANPLEIPPISGVVEKDYKHMVEDFFAVKETKRKKS